MSRNGSQELNTKRLAESRALLNALVSPKVVLTVSALREATGIEEDRIRELLVSDEYQKELRSLLKMRVLALVLRGTQAMDGILSGIVGATNREKTAAMRAMVSAYTALIEADEKPPEDDPEDFEGKLGKLDKRPKVTVEDDDERDG